MTDPVTEQRLAAQLLAGPPARTASAVAERLLAVQAQDPRGARLAVRARTDRLTAADVDRELTEQRSLVIGWLNRGTLHLVRSEDYWWLHALTTPPLATGISRRLAQEGVPPGDADRGVTAIERALASDGPLIRNQLAGRVAAAGVRTERQALVHILSLASLRGLIVRGPMAGGSQAYVLAREWLGPPPGLADRDRALAELARRYLAGHGPASDRDLAKWAGLPLRDARRGLSAIAGELAGRPDGLAALASAGAAGHGLPPPRLLGAFEPVLLGWTSREPIAGPHIGKLVSGGLFRPFAMVAGRAAATWGITGGDITLSEFAPVTAADAAALADDTAGVRRFLGLPAPPGSSGAAAPAG
jgi:hypothetical protein